MGWQIIKQTAVPSGAAIDGIPIEEGKYCIFSSIPQAIIYFNCTREEVVSIYEADAAQRVRMLVEDKLTHVDRGEPAYYQFTKTLAQALAETRLGRNEDEFDEDAEDDNTSEWTPPLTLEP